MTTEIRYCVACRKSIDASAFENGCERTGRAHVRVGDSALAKLYPDPGATAMSDRFAASLPGNPARRSRRKKRRNGPSHG